MNAQRSTPWLISVDDHVVEPPDLWWSRLPRGLRERGPRVVRDSCRTQTDALRQTATYTKGGDGPITDWWVYEDLAKPVPQTLACAGYPPERFTLKPIRYKEMRPGCFRADARLEDMDLNRTERSLCFPTVSRFAGQMFLEAKDKGLALLCVKAYNDWMLDEWCGDSDRRLIPICLVPLWDPVVAAEEVRRTADRGCRAISFSEMPSYLGLPSIHDPRRWWDPLFEACDETGTVVCMHIGSGSRLVETSPYAPHIVDLVLTFNNAQVSFVEWLVSGVLVQFPNLKVVYSESQIGWMPYVLERLDKAFLNARAWAREGIVFDRLPSEYVPGRVYGSFFDDETGIEQRHAIGVGQLLLEVDYPHQDSTWPHTEAIVEKLAVTTSPDELDRIVSRNATELFGLEPLRSADAAC